MFANPTEFVMYGKHPNNQPLDLIDQSTNQSILSINQSTNQFDRSTAGPGGILGDSPEGAYGRGSGGGGAKKEVRRCGDEVHGAGHVFQPKFQAAILASPTQL